MAHIRIGIIGDFEPAYHSHFATNAALYDAATKLKIPVELHWLPTPSLEAPGAEKILRRWDGLVASPGWRSCALRCDSGRGAGKGNSLRAVGVITSAVMVNPTLRGRFLWHELMTTDTKSAADFFTKVVGWKTQAWDQNPSYTMFTVNRRPMAGLMALPEDAKKMGAPPSWVSYIGTPNVDETARQADARGGKIMKPPTDIPTIGRFAIIKDPQGAIFAAFTPLPSSSDMSPVAGFSWHELPTTDWRAALAFYKDLFGWEETDSMDMGAMGTYQMFGWKGQMLGGMFNKPQQSPGPPAWLPYIQVPDSKKAAATVKKLGAQIINGPMEVPGGSWIAAGLDLQGAAFAVHSPKPAAKSRKPGKAKTARRAAAAKPAKSAKPSKKKKLAAKKRKTKSADRRAAKKKR